MCELVLLELSLFEMGCALSRVRCVIVPPVLPTLYTTDAANETRLLENDVGARRTEAPPHALLAGFALILSLVHRNLPPMFGPCAPKNSCLPWPRAIPIVSLEWLKACTASATLLDYTNYTLSNACLDGAVAELAVLSLAVEGRFDSGPSPRIHGRMRGVLG